MDTFWKASAIIVMVIIFSVTIGKTEKDIALVLSILSSCLVLMIAISYLTEVVTFLRELADCPGYEYPFVEILLRVTGVALMTEFIGVFCTDAGNSSLAKAMQILGTSVILFLSLPLFESLFTIIQEIVRVL